GFIIGDQELTGSGVVPVLWTGRVLRENLPVELEAPDNPYQFTFEPPFPAGDSGENGGGE
ncbi:hypothetical protein ACP3V9_25250, partial [Salmonella enterica]|uniref:hypothetical protein n=1 Tax=Salmonella enterica TaxID=28901 RepID=UPI003CF59976